ncbi:PTS system protein [Parelusimicrobium proximum]|uniref:PTS sugar transporter subunit IIA n=1 Tax=Parelusimicrobium proximum TaxID=3228953 RepID=UPI003D1775FF
MSSVKYQTVLKLLSKENVVIVDSSTTKESLISRLVELACGDLSLADRDDVLNKVLAREAGISTTLESGLSIPHSRVTEIEDFRAAMAVLHTPIKDKASSLEVEIKVMFLFLSPSDPTFFQKHLQVLAELSEMFRPDFVKQITETQSTEEALLLLGK